LEVEQMSCRTTPAGSLFTTCARLFNDNKISDGNVLSLFHELRRNYETRPAEERKVYTRDEYDQLLSRQYDRINRRNYPARQRESMLSRLNLASEGAMPDQGILYALHNITPRVRKRGERLEAFQLELSEKFNLPIEVVAQSFQDLEKMVRGTHNPVTYTKENRKLSIEYGLGIYPGTVHAVAVLTDQVKAIDNIEALNAPKRIVRKEILDVEKQKTNISNVKILEYGQDIRNGRVEVVILDESTGVQSEHAYTNVYRTLSEDEISSYWSNTLRGINKHAYLTSVSSEVASRAPNCPTCGQFADSNHGCPIILEPKVLRRFHTRDKWSPEWIQLGESETQYQVELPTSSELQNAFQSGSLIVESILQSIPREGTDRFYLVKGKARVRLNEEDKVAVKLGGLSCDCGAEAPCEHIKLIGTLILNRILTPVERRVPLSGDERRAVIENAIARMNATAEGEIIESILPIGRRTRELDPAVILRQQERIIEANRRREEVLATDWTRQQNSLEEARSTWNGEAELLYSENFSEFKADFDEAVRLRAENENKPVIKYVKENALDGMATRASGQGFGVELEYEFPGDWGEGDINRANRAIGRALHDANLTASRGQQEYHSAAYNGYANTHLDANGRGTWSFEDDGSVTGGELVSPTMYDEPETWEKLEQAIKILRDNGAVPTTHAGGHVHVGTGFYQGSPAKYAELGRLMTQHEDVIYRLASDPERGTHRGVGYTYPCPPVPANGFTTIRDVHWSGRGALNYGHVNGGNDDHPEFRVFDSTLDAGAVQAHIKMSVAMTHAAARIAETGSTQRAKEALGDHERRASVLERTTNQIQYLEEDSATLRSFLDTIFRRREDKSQLTSLFANTRWSVGDNNNARGAGRGRRFR